MNKQLKDAREKYEKLRKKQVSGAWKRLRWEMKVWLREALGAIYTTLGVAILIGFATLLITGLTTLKESTTEESTTTATNITSFMQSYNYTRVTTGTYDGTQAQLAGLEILASFGLLCLGTGMTDSGICMIQRSKNKECYEQYPVDVVKPVRTAFL